MILIHSDQQFEFRIDRSPLEGVFVLNAEQKAQLRKLLESEPEYWYLDRNGERLPSEQLFEASPWSMQTSEGVVKILNRFLNLETGDAIFNVPETYAGEWFRWLRNKISSA